MDQKVRYYSCKRQTKRWPFVLWMNMMDIAAMNGEMVFSVQHPTYHGKRNDKRRLFPKDLVEELVKPQITVRSATPNLPKRTLDAMTRCGLELTPSSPVATCVGKRRRCEYCPHAIHRKSTVQRCV
ncbi:hypothetical protein C0J52_19244 [Blattella germanica]|nr:hypothetical protein C0J52_19244 [Blattella germanica]